MYWVLLGWAAYNFLGCYAHLRGGTASFPRLTAAEAFLNVLIAAWVANQIYQG